ncbi:MAG: hypothetical protein HZA53_05425 [Planctomycetes bacterium]|nr:hypothetical protein [Planctomycetota bacterium]
MRLLPLHAVVLALLAPYSPTARAQCPGWSTEFGVAGLTTLGPGNGVLEVAAVATFDDGTGPALYAGGTFMTASSVQTPRIARWNGTSWSSVGGGFTELYGAVRALCVFDDGLGGGPSLYAGGSFTQASGTPANGVARWNGTSWSALGPGISGTVSALTAIDDGSGPALYAGGDFTSAGGASAQNVARWNGTSWSSLGAGLFDPPREIVGHDDGAGTKVYVAHGSYVTRWTGAAWQTIGNLAVTIPNPPVPPFPFPYAITLASYDDGGGAQLYVGGRFDSVNGVSALNLARWDGAAWSSVPNAPIPVPGRWVNALRTLDYGLGPKLYVGGLLLDVYRFDGATWSSLGAMNDVTGFAGHDAATPGGNWLYAVGGFTQLANGAEANRVAVLQNGSWSPVGGGLGFDGPVYAFANVDEGATTALYAGGAFARASGTTAQRIARWNGNGWSPLGTGVNSTVSALAAHASAPGGERELYAGGDFTAAGGLAADHIARWNGSAWSALGTGMPEAVYALCSFDDGTGPALYAGGRFLVAGGTTAWHVARWNGTSWSDVGGGIAGTFVSALAVHDDGGGPALYAAGWFSSAGGTSASNVARWNGTSWSALGAGVGDQATTLCSFDDGGGRALHVGGAFTTAGGAPGAYVARWRNGAWSALGAGLSAFPFALLAHDDGAGGGPALYVTGAFSVNGGAAVERIARWNGSAWTPLGAGLGYNGGRALASVHDGTSAGASLFVGGEFTTAGGQQSSYVARWRSCASGPAEYCFGDGALGAACPCGNTSAVGQRAGCANSTGQGGRIAASGVASVGADTLVLATSEAPSNATVLFLQGAEVENGGLGAPLGDGLLCIGGALVRLGTKPSAGGAAQYPLAGDPSVSVRGGVSAGSVRSYQAYYRNVASFCTPATFNLTNAVRVRWIP